MVPAGRKGSHDFFMAERMKARIDSQAVDHTPLASVPESVVRLIVAAAEGSLDRRISIR